MDSEDPFLMPTDATVTDSVLLVLSHLFILLAIANAMHRRLHYVASSMSLMLLNSVQYHMCRANWSCGIYGTPLAYDSSSYALYRSRVSDHAAANHGVVAMLFAVLTSDPSGGLTVSGLRILLLGGTFTAEEAFPLQTMALILALVCMMSVMCIYVWLSVKGRLPDTSRFHLGLLALALLVLGLGYFMFSITSISYGIAHSIWHVCIGLAIFIITEGIHVGRGNASWFNFNCQSRTSLPGVF